jgi:hypothetical protein
MAEGPLGPARQDYWQSRLLAIVANIARGTDAKPVEPQDFIAWLRTPEAETETGEEHGDEPPASVAEERADFEAMFEANFK